MHTNTPLWYEHFAVEVVKYVQDFIIIKAGRFLCGFSLLFFLFFWFVVCVPGQNETIVEPHISTHLGKRIQISPTLNCNQGK